MAINAASLLRITATVLAALLVGLTATWGALALWYRTPGGRAPRRLRVLAWVGLSVALLTALLHGCMAAGLLAYAAAFGALLIWWQRIAPSNDRNWADDVARMTTGTVEGNRVTLHNVRNFDWRTMTDYTVRWDTRGYDLDRLMSVDMIMSYWNRPAIAHMLISFGFEGGEHAVFSVEIRREKIDVYSEIAGLFKEFELSVIAADERDVVRLRTNIRGEDVYLFRLRMPLPAMRSLFLGYIAEANALAAAPRFYHTITVNCTSLVYRMMKRIVGRLPLSYRLIFSGYLPEYVYRIGGLDRRHSLQELRALARITERAKKADRSDTFSADIRQGIPAAGGARRAQRRSVKP